jgi:hypothetical protein
MISGVDSYLAADIRAAGAMSNLFLIQRGHRKRGGICVESGMYEGEETIHVIFWLAACEYAELLII